MTDRLVFSKSKQARYISHLDLMRTFQRAFYRGGIEIRHTEGFHPHPFVSIALPMSVGYSSDCEILEFGLVSGATYETLPRLLTKAMPEGIEVSSCYQGEIKLKHIIYLQYRIILEYGTAVPTGAKEAWTEFLSQEHFVVEKKSKKAKSGKVDLDIMPLIHEFTLQEEEGKLALDCLLTAQNPGLNPELIRTAFVGVHPEFTPEFVHYHRVEVFDKEKNIFR